jgi:hypothetical protein
MIDKERIQSPQTIARAAAFVFLLIFLLGMLRINMTVLPQVIRLTSRSSVRDVTYSHS